jgi:hypothetical protein
MYFGQRANQGKQQSTQGHSPLACDRLLPGKSGSRLFTVSLYYFLLLEGRPSLEITWLISLLNFTIQLIS